MNPVLFGTRERQLFGIHTPAAGARRRKGAVICPPLGQEYERAHRACRLLAERLAGAGIDVLRFDYFGTGDSFGTGDAVTLEGCTEDARAAIEELCAIGDLRRVTLIGLRVGAIVATRAAAASRAVERLVLWDPVCDGPRYLEQTFLPATTRTASRAARPLRLVGGARFSDALESELSNTRPDRFEPGARDVLLISSDQLPEHVALRDHLAREHALEWTVHPGAQPWVEEADLGVGAVPVEALDRIVTWVGGMA